MRINFKGFSDSSLCDKCQCSQISITVRGERIVNCSALGAFSPQAVNPNIIDCNRFFPIGMPSQYDMEKQAWILEVNKGQPVGFSPPKKDT